MNSKGRVGMLGVGPAKSSSESDRLGRASSSPSTQRPLSAARAGGHRKWPAESCS